MMSIALTYQLLSFWQVYPFVFRQNATQKDISSVLRVRGGEWKKKERSKKVGVWCRPVKDV